VSERNTDHVRLLDGWFTCLHCGARYQMNLPCPIDVFTAACNAYVAVHAGCTPGQQAAPRIQFTAKG